MNFKLATMCQWHQFPKLSNMKSTIVATKQSKPKNPWEDVEYPCLIEHRDGSLAIATSDESGYMIHDSDDDSPCEEVDTSDQHWKQEGWTPVIGPRTVTFEN